MAVTQSLEVCRDPKDDKFLELAVSAQASYLVTNDKDLLVLNPFQAVGVRMRTDFLSLKAMQ